jgi:myosin heavy subunit
LFCFVHAHHYHRKTESTKHILHYLAVQSCRVAARLGAVCAEGGFEGLITAAMPVTESFGNATTSRNNNSSRFAKFIELLYTADGYVDGATIHTYLLETVRMTSQNNGERNFHVFYELFAGLSEAQKAEWNFPSLESFMYTNQSGEYHRHDGISDKQNFLLLQDALGRMNISDFEQDDIFKVLIAILHIGNIEFSESQASGDEGALFSEASQPHVDCACAFLGLPADTLLRALTRRRLLVAGSEVLKALTVGAAAASRDAAARYLYEQLFNSMVRDINVCIGTADESNITSFIGVLDIFGFEHFEENSFEQLSINYANEKLQDHFNYSVFVSEREVYAREGIAWSAGSYPDNTPVLDLFERRVGGLFSLCDEQLKIPQPTDQKLYSSLVAKCSSSKYFKTSRVNKAKGVFTVKHFAFAVEYNTAGFLDKNRNEVAFDISSCFASSRLPVMRKIRGDASQTDPALRRAHSSFQSAPTKARTIAAKKTVTLAAQFCKNLQNLMGKVRTTRSHFVRCVKPNERLAASYFDYAMVMNQLRCGGALDALRVFRTGFSNRMEFQFFATRYALILTICGCNPVTKGLSRSLRLGRQTGGTRHWRSAAHHLIGLVPLTFLILSWLQLGEHGRDRDSGALDAASIAEGLQIGRRQLFCRAHIFEYLELMRKMALDYIAHSLQRRRRARALGLQREGNSSFLAVQSVIYFSDFRMRKARRHVCAAFTIQRRCRVFLAVLKRKFYIVAVSLLHSAARRFLARRRAALLRRARAVRRRVSARQLQRRWRAHRTAASRVSDRHSTFVSNNMQYYNTNIFYTMLFHAMLFHALLCYVF